MNVLKSKLFAKSLDIDITDLSYLVYGPRPYIFYKGDFYRIPDILFKPDNLKVMTDSLYPLKRATYKHSPEAKIP